MFKKLFGDSSTNPATSERREPTLGAPSGNDSKSGVDNLIEIAEILRDLMRAHYQDERGIHVETVISATAALTGYAALQAAIVMIDEGRPEARQHPQFQPVQTKNGQTFVFCELANQLVASAGGPGRLTVLTLVANSGFRAGSNFVPDMLEITRRNAQFVGSDNYPPLTIPAQHFPSENAIDALRLWWPAVKKVFSVRELSSLHPLYRMFALAHATGHWIEEARNVLDPGIAVTLAMETAVATSKIPDISKLK